MRAPDPRTQPPDTSSAVLRPRLVSLLARRWDTRVLVVVAGAGAGKTIALAQALEQNALAPRGRDLWLTCTPPDSDATGLAEALLALLDRPLAADADQDSERFADAVADAVWLRAPEPICVVLDDAHNIEAGSAGWRLLAGLVERLPANGHLVVATRTEPDLALARLVAAGDAARVDEVALRFDGIEQQAFAAARSVDVATIAATGGLPALAALAAVSGRADVVRFLWEEVLARLPPERLRGLAAFAAIGGGDRELTPIATGWVLDDLVADLPLVERRPDGSCRLHDLWSQVLTGVLPPEEERAALVAAASWSRRVDRVDDAFTLLADAGAWPEALDVVRETCLASGSQLIPLARLRRWLDRIPAAYRDADLAVLLRGIVTRAIDPWSAEAWASLTDARDRLAASGDAQGEAIACAQLAYLAWIREDVATLVDVFARLDALAASGAYRAASVAALGRAFLDDARGDDEGVLRALASIDRSELSTEGRARTAWFRANALWMLGRMEEATDAAIETAALAGPTFQTGLAAPLVAAFFDGRPEDVLAAVHGPALLARSHATERDRFLSTTFTAIAYGYIGLVDVDVGDLDTAQAVAAASGSARAVHLVALAVAARAAGGGDDAGAAAALGEALAIHPLADGPVERVLRRHLALVSVLRPETGPFWAERPLGPAWARARTLADAFAAWRDRGDTAGLEARPWRRPGDVVSQLPLPWACEVAAVTRDEALGAYLIDLVRHRARRALRTVATSGTGPAPAGARRLLRALPTPPLAPLAVRVLGPVGLERGGEPIRHPDWRRERVRTLLCFLVARRRALRGEAAVALWPELDADSSAANLRTTLGYLHRVLEPDRDAGDAPWHVRSDGDVLYLVDDGLTVDTWALEGQLARAEAAAADGVPGVELEHLVAALALWRGEYLAGLYDDWAGLERDRIRARLLAASVRAGALLLARHEIDPALTIATRALEHEPWSEGAHRLVLAAHLARGDRASARRALVRCQAALADLGVEPEAETAMLARQITG